MKIKIHVKYYKKVLNNYNVRKYTRVYKTQATDFLNNLHEKHVIH